MAFKDYIPILGGFLDGIIGGISQSSENQKNRAFQEKMWNMQNEYNKPINQMARFKEAGLNPNLIYGQGNAGNAVLANTSNQEAPKFNFAEKMLAYTAMRKQATEIDNVKKQNEVLESQKALNEAQKDRIVTDNETQMFDLQYKKDMLETSKAKAVADLNDVNANVAQKEQAIRNMIKDIDVKSSQISLNNKQISNISQGIAESVQRVQNLKQENRLKGVEIEIQKIIRDIRKTGANPNDPGWQKIIYDTLSPFVPGTVKDVQSFFNITRDYVPNPVRPWDYPRVIDNWSKIVKKRR